MSIPRNLGAFADNLTSTGTLNVGGINATGTPSSTTFLAGNGSWSAPSSAMTLISTKTASSSANVIWTGLSGYTRYMIVFDQLTTSQSSIIGVQYGYGATPTYYTSYTSQLLRGSSSTASSVLSSATTTARLTGTAAGYAQSGWAILTGVDGSASAFFNVTSTFNAISTSSAGMVGTYANTGTTPLTALKLLAEAGTITGNATLYGLSS